MVMHYAVTVSLRFLGKFGQKRNKGNDQCSTDYQRRRSLRFSSRQQENCRNSLQSKFISGINSDIRLFGLILFADYLIVDIMVRTAAKVKHFNAVHKRKFYEVERIVSKRVIRGKTFYEVKWVGFDW